MPRRRQRDAADRGLEVEPCRQAIREVFIDSIVNATKGHDEARERIGGGVLPTPVAVFEAARLPSEGADGEPGLGDLVVVAVGGATTDVCSIARGLPTSTAVALRRLPEPFAKRTVVGDLGVRHDIDTPLARIHPAAALRLLKRRLRAA